MVEAKQEGKPQPPMEKEETAFQYDRVQHGQVDSARLLLVFGMVPATSYLDKQTTDMFIEEREKVGAAEDAQSDSSQVPAVLDPTVRYPDGSTPLHMAASFGLTESVRTLAKARADVSAVARTGVQPIHAASIMGHVGAVSLLAELRANVDARHAFAGSTPLHFATEMGHADVVRRLCALGADVEAEKKHGGTAIHISADTNNSAVTQALIDDPCGADPDAVLLGDTVPLYLAAGRGFHTVIDVLLQAGASADRTLWPSRPWKRRRRRKGGKKMSAPPSSEVQVASNPAHNLPGSDPNAPGWEVANGATALHNAAENGHRQAALALLDGGALQLATMQGITPLHSALQYKHPDVACALLDHRTPANVGVQNPMDGQTALHLAAAYDYPGVVVRILREGGATGVRDRRGNLAQDYARGQLVAFLLQRFHGREPRLDAIIRQAHSPGADLAARLSAARDVPMEAKDLYVQLSEAHDEGRLLAELQTVTGKLRDRGTPQREVDELARRFAIGRFILAGSDEPLAVEAIMQKTKASMEVALVLLDVRVDALEYIPSKKLLINGHDALDAVHNAILAAHKSAEVGNRLDFDEAVSRIRDIARGRSQHSPQDSPGQSQGESDDEDWAEL